MVRRLGYLVLLVLAIVGLAWAPACVDIANSGRDSNNNEPPAEDLLPAGAACDRDEQCASGDCIMDTGRCR